MAIKPVGEYIAVKQADEGEKMVGGILLVQTSPDTYLQGEVVAVGDGKKLENGTYFPLKYEIGETVLFHPYAGVKVKYDLEEFTLLQDSDIFAKIEEDCACGEGEACAKTNCKGFPTRS